MSSFVLKVTCLQDDATVFVSAETKLFAWFFSSLPILPISTCVDLSCVLVISKAAPFQGKCIKVYGILSSVRRGMFWGGILYCHSLLLDIR